MADEYFDFDHEYNFRDRDVLLLGKVVPTIQKSFDEFWNDPLSVPVTSLVDQVVLDSIQADTYEKLHQYACNPENFWPQVRTRIEQLPKTFSAIQQSGDLVWLDSVDFVSDYPGKNKSESLSGSGVTTDSLMELIRHAKHSVLIQSPYLITTDKGRQLFKHATAHGVEVKILTNSLSSTDNLEAFSGYQRDRKKLLETGVRVFEYRPDAKERYTIMTGELQKEMNFAPIFGLHAKSMVIDGKITVIGTFNLDPRSANLNTECFTVIHSEKVSAGVTKGMEVEFLPENSWETTLQFNPDKEAGLTKRLKTMTKHVVPKNIL
jgi:phosphatidylserine/phosphatidylglycerophosphate/cardiolipin synthase-like enzyme